MRGSLIIRLEDDVELGEETQLVKVEFPIQLQTCMPHRDFRQFLYSSIGQNLASIVDTALAKFEKAKTKVVGAYDKQQAKIKAEEEAAAAAKAEAEAAKAKAEADKTKAAADKAAAAELKKAGKGDTKKEAPKPAQQPAQE